MGRADAKLGKPGQQIAAARLDVTTSSNTLVDLIRLLARQAAREFVASRHEPAAEDCSDDQEE